MRQDQDGVFGPALRALREAHGLSQSDLATRLGMETKVVGAMESAQIQSWDPALTKRVADALDMAPALRHRLEVARIVDAGTIQLPTFENGPSAEACAALAKFWPDVTDDDISVLVGRVARRKGASGERTPGPAILARAKVR